MHVSLTWFACISAALAFATPRDAGAQKDDVSSEGSASLDLQSLGFMSGCWRGATEGGGVLEEFYTSPSARLMLGVSRFLVDGDAVQFEFSRISSDSTGVVLLPFPGGTPAAHGFRLTRSGEGMALFEAPEHDFPRRISYTSGADGSLTARIDGGEGDARIQEWRMSPVSCGSAWRNDSGDSPGAHGGTQGRTQRTQPDVAPPPPAV